MKTYDDFLNEAVSRLSAFPSIAQRYRVGDPLVVAQIQAMANMLAMASADVAIHAAEPFIKATDATVLADATVKGILPFGVSAKQTVTVTNGNSTPYNLATGRVILDSQGREYRIVSGGVIAAGGSASFEIIQYSQRSFTHAVTISQAFYMVRVPKAEGGKFIAEVSVFNGSMQKLEYRPDFVNAESGDLVYHIQSDQSQNLNIKFGAKDFTGYQPNTGEVITVRICDCAGEIDLSVGAKFSFEYTASPMDNEIKIELISVQEKGAAPLSIPVIREIAMHSSIYNDSAVYNGNFISLVRRKIRNFRFLNIWNEQREELARGASIDNINALFIAAKKDGVSDADLFAEISAIIKQADDSYKLVKVDVDDSEIDVSVSVKVPAIYDFAEVEQQIKDAILSRWGRDSDFAKKGDNRVLYKTVYSVLTAEIPALQTENSDLEVEVNDTSIILPESYRYVSDDSLTITVGQML